MTNLQTQLLFCESFVLRKLMVLQKKTHTQKAPKSCQAQVIRHNAFCLKVLVFVWFGFRKVIVFPKSKKTQNTKSKANTSKHKSSNPTLIVCKFWICFLKTMSFKKQQKHEKSPNTNLQTQLICIIHTKHNSKRKQMYTHVVTIWGERGGGVISM